MKALIAALAALLPCAVAAQSACAPHGAQVTHLAERFGESRYFIGLEKNNAVMEVYANAESGTWTITMTRPGGLTCIVADGIAFGAEPPVAIGDPT